ncbi:MAG: zinc ribbon domain-containing protein [Chloroflexia bacterium]
MYCPNCGYEYQDWATVCTDCGTNLLPGRPPRPDPPAPLPDDGRLDDWTILTNVPNTFMGNVLKDQLEQEGIPVLLKRMRSTDIAEWSHNDFVAHDVYVPMRFIPQGREILAGRPTGDAWAEGGDDEEDDADEGLPTSLNDYGIGYGGDGKYRPRQGEYEEYDTGMTNWSHSRVYRILMGLLLLTWTLPFLWKMVEALVESWGRFFR